MRKLLLLAMSSMISFGLADLPILADTLCLPQGTQVMESWGNGQSDPITVAMDTVSQAVVRRGSTVLIKGEFNGAQTKALELYIDRRLVASKDYGGRYEFRWQASAECGTYRLKVAELRRNGQRFIVWNGNVEIVERNPIQITSPASGSELFHTTPVQFTAAQGYEPTKLGLYANGRLVGSFYSGEMLWNVPVMPPGTYTIWLEGESAAGAVRSDPVQVRVPVRVSLAKPIVNEKLVVTETSAQIALAATIHPEVATKKIDYLLNGKTIAESTSQLTTGTWDATDVAPGSYKLSARLFDQEGHIYESCPVTIDINNPPYRRRQAEAMARHQAEEQKRRQEAEAKAQEARGNRGLLLSREITVL